MLLFVHIDAEKQFVSSGSHLFMLFFLASGFYPEGEGDDEATIPKHQ